MKRLLITTAALFILTNIFSQNARSRYTVGANLEIDKVSAKMYIHVSYAETKWGRVASNGLILVEDGKAFIFDTPMDEATTVELVKFIRDSLRANITGFVANHWHDDCIGGLAYLHSLGIKSYANRMTAELAKKNGYAVPENTFTDSLELQLGKQKIFCFYPGAAHTLDNIVVWFPGENILFGGCMVKEMKTNSMGNIVDGDLKAWPITITKVMDKFPNAWLVVPGHGQPGGLELLKHTYELAKANGQGIQK